MIEKLNDLRLLTICLSWGATGFEIEGKKGGDYYRYSLSTMFEICFDADSVFKTDILQHESTVELWNYLDKTLLEVVVSDDNRVCELKFENNKSIFIWSEEHDHDSLLTVRSSESDEWFTIG